MCNVSHTHAPKHACTYTWKSHVLVVFWIYVMFKYKYTHLYLNTKCIFKNQYMHVYTRGYGIFKKKHNFAKYDAI